MNVAELSSNLKREFKRRKYFVRMETLEQTMSLMKSRLFISTDLFVQIYRNDRYSTTKLALIHNGKRIFARDEVDEKWHRHTHLSPDIHDFSPDGQIAIELSEFLDEVEKVLADLNLP
jgi:hypothetical protein